MTLIRIVLGVCTYVASLAIAAPSTAPTDIPTASQRAQDKLSTTAAAWTTAIDSGDAVLQADVVQTPTARRMTFSVVANGKTAPLGSIIERDGFWFVDEDGKTAKYRPFEAPLTLPNLYLLRELAELHFVDAAEAKSLGQLASSEHGVATFRTPLSADVQDQVRNVLVNINSLAEQNPQLLDNAATRNQIRQMNDLLKNGVSRTIDANLGIVLEVHTLKMNVRTSGFHWLTSAQPPEVSVDGVKWSDMTDDLVTKTPGELIMIANNAMWHPSEQAGDMNACLLDLASGRLHRLPYRGVQSSTGCFSKDRKRVYVVGVDAQTGAMPLVEIDLQTGDNRPLGGELLAVGMTMAPTLSPDGKSLLVSHKNLSDGKLLEWETCLVDIASGNAKKIGQPMDASFLNWLPDGTGIILDVRDSRDMNKPSIDTISRMDLSGKITPIRSGRNPLLLADGKTILFADPTDNLWKTCDLTGQKVKLLGDGFTGHGFPSLAPDGQRILFIKFDKDAGPKPTIYKIGETTGKSVTDRPGLWAMPAWK